MKPALVIRPVVASRVRWPARLALVAALAGGCVSMPAAPPSRPVAGAIASTDPSPAEATGGSQSLYRLVHDRGEGRTSLKVVLREGAGERFQITVSDLAGRRVLSFDHAASRIVLVDHREESFCVTGPSLTLPEVHPDELPLAAVPRVLAGQFPLPDVAAERMKDDEWVDPAGRRWRVVRDGGELVAWSLFDDEGPALWWARDGAGGILSRRGGEQYRWRLVVREEASDPLADLVPEGYVEGVCDE